MRRQHMRRTVSLWGGFSAGVLAAAPMSVLFWFGQRLGTIDELPPLKAARAVSPDLGGAGHARLATIAHMSVAGAAGVAYAVLVGCRRPGPLTGVLLGVGVWVVGYELVMPALTGMPKAHRDERRRATTIFVAHVIYGASVGLVSKGVARPRA